jgi:hypothetical protein
VYYYREGPAPLQWDSWDTGQFLSVAGTIVTGLGYLLSDRKSKDVLGVLGAFITAATWIREVTPPRCPECGCRSIASVNYWMCPDCYRIVGVRRMTQ